MWDVFGFGIVAVDDLVYLDHHPLPDTKMPVRAKQRQGGGLTGTALVAAARLGAKVAYGGILGEDDLSLYTIRELEREGVDCSPVLRRPGARPCHSIILVDQQTGQRVILYSAEGVVPRQPGEVDEEMIRQCRVLFVDSSMGYGGLQAVRLAQAVGVETVADIERFTVPGAQDLMDAVGHLIVGIDLAQQVTGETEPEQMVCRLSSPQRPCLAVTAGDRGCWYSERGGEVHHVPAYRVQVVDTTGCGDVFHGAYAASLAQGESVAAAIRFASATAALKATQPGGRAGIPDRPTVDCFMQERGTL